jgi:hypothetical protein
MNRLCPAQPCLAGKTAGAEVTPPRPQR